jgi:hypothetical protein
VQESKPIRFDDLAEVSRKGNLRRSADLGRWLRHHLEDRRPTQRHEEAKTQIVNTIIALISPSRRQAI